MKVFSTITANKKLVYCSSAATLKATAPPRDLPYKINFWWSISGLLNKYSNDATPSNSNPKIKKSTFKFHSAGLEFSILQYKQISEHRM